MRICDKCKKPLSEANIRRLRVAYSSGVVASFPNLDNIELCPGCMNIICDNIRQMIFMGSFSDNSSESSNQQSGKEGEE